MKYLGVDFGIKRVGLAVSEGELASPWKVLEGRGPNDLMDKLGKEASDFDQIIIGLPEGKMGELVKKVVANLQKKGLDIVTSDETLSSKNATSLMVELAVPKKKRKVNDAYSAAIILQNYLDDLTSNP